MEQRKRTFSHNERAPRPSPGALLEASLDWAVQGRKGITVFVCIRRGQGKKSIK